jgi:POT family proton-dependent oligopeptide transporter
MTEDTRTVVESAPDRGRGGFFGHPWGLANLAGVELWERFSFYGMQGILIYYLYYRAGQGGLGLSQAAATSIVGAYGGLVYLSAILGAWFADRLLGAERSLTAAAVIIMLGHISLAVVPGITGVGIGLVCVAIGSGTLKTTTSSVLGDLYDRTDDRRDAAFSIYYMGVNIGALVGPLLTGLLWKEQGFHWGFGLAAIGMALGLTQYLLLRRRTLRTAGRVVGNPLPAAGRIRYAVIAAVAIAVIVVLSLIGVITADRLSTIVVVVTVIASIVLFTVMLTSPKVSAIERRRVLSFIPMFVASAAFWSLFQQMFTVIAVYADKRLDRSLFGWQMPPTWVQSIEPIFVIVFAGVFAAMWTRLGPRQPSTPTKFALGTALMGVAFLLLVPFSGSGPNGTPLLWLALVLLMFCLAELCLSPVGQSLATKLAPDAFHNQMIALFFLSIAVGTSAAGALATFYTTDDEFTYFLIVGASSIAVGLVVAALGGWIRRMMSGVR